MQPRPPHPSALTLAPVLASLMLSAPVLAQSEEEEAIQPGGVEQVEEAEKIMPRVGTDQTPVLPTQPAVSEPVQPGLTGGEDWLRVLHETLETEVVPSALAEGAFIMGRHGQLVPGPMGLLIFVPDKETRLAGEGPMLLMPSTTLAQLQNEWTGQPVRVSGEIFSYHGRNHLLLSAYQLINEPAPGEETDSQAEPSSAPQDASGEHPAEPEPSSIEADPAVRDLLDELEQQLSPDDAGDEQTSVHERLESAQNRGIPRPPVVVNDRVPPGFEEGTLILRRPARMTRGVTGAWTLVFDNDDPMATDAPELTVLPCRALMRMEHIAMEQGDADQLLVSGRVYTYHGGLYFLPTLEQRVRAGELNPLQ
ncbi:MAG: hypothetical protein WD114_05690 [Phycisphaerales bacterium]